MQVVFCNPTERHNMAERKKKTLLIVTAEKLANLDVIDHDAPGGAAYKAFMIRCVAQQLELLAAALEDEAKEGFDGMVTSK